MEGENQAPPKVAWVSASRAWSGFAAPVMMTRISTCERPVRSVATRDRPDPGHSPGCQPSGSRETSSTGFQCEDSGKSRMAGNGGRTVGRRFIDFPENCNLNPELLLQSK